ncbi:hypothetical protein CRG98_000761 [Punica granatum]|uniref:Uncharacterized protein n=1 Tax=Punica granatum TaxID=22663 RepID=A0A2I0LF48_PUNGR|nr:hypothetical protein CRG98_000761 [Punica granatum]
MDVEEVWTCMGMHACKPKGRWSMVGGHMDTWARGRRARARGRRTAGLHGRASGRSAGTIHPRVTISPEMHS